MNKLSPPSYPPDAKLLHPLPPSDIGGLKKLRFSIKDFGNDKFDDSFYKIPKKKLNTRG